MLPELKIEHEDEKDDYFLNHKGNQLLIKVKRVIISQLKEWSKIIGWVWRWFGLILRPRIAKETWIKKEKLSIGEKRG